MKLMRVGMRHKRKVDNNFERVKAAGALLGTKGCELAKVVEGKVESDVM